MGIADKKREILRLVEQLNAQSRLGKPGRKSNTDKNVLALVKKRSIDENSIPRKKESDRESERDPVEERLLTICKQLDKRIKNIEDFIGANFVETESNGVQLKNGINVASNKSETPTSRKNPQDSSRDSRNTGENSRSPDSTLTQEQEYCLGGKIQEGILPDILQLVSSNNKTGVFCLQQNSQRIELYFDDGTLYHAKTENMVGQNAFFAAMALEGGRFYFIESDDIPSERTIDGNTQFMILEALRQIDEQRNQQ
jgi:hypothetical protein